LVIEANPGVTQSEVGRLLDIAGANMAPLMRRLEDRDLIERNPVDGRSQALHLSADGRALSAKARKIFRSHEEELLGKIPPGDRATFMKNLRALYCDLSE
jgi:DNA-binding MarR family transcriptional regulator